MTLRTKIWILWNKIRGIKPDDSERPELYDEEESNCGFYLLNVANTIRLLKKNRKHAKLLYFEPNSNAYIDMPSNFFSTIREKKMQDVEWYKSQTKDDHITPYFTDQQIREQIQEKYRYAHDDDIAVDL